MASQGGDMPRSTNVCRKPAPQKRQIARFAEVLGCTLTCLGTLLIVSFRSSTLYDISNKRMLCADLPVVRRVGFQLESSHVGRCGSKRCCRGRSRRKCSCFAPRRGSQAHLNPCTAAE